MYHVRNGKQVLFGLLLPFISFIHLFLFHFHVPFPFPISPQVDSILFLLVFLVCCHFRDTFCICHKHTLTLTHTHTHTHTVAYINIFCVFVALFMSSSLQLSLCFCARLTLRILNTKVTSAHWIKSGSWCQVPEQSGSFQALRQLQLFVASTKKLKDAAPTNQIRGSPDYKYFFHSLCVKK